MSYDIQPILTDIDAANPCGVDITYDPLFVRLENSFQNTSSGILGQGAADGGPNWKEVAEQSYGLLKTSKHLRLAVYFAIGLFKLEGFEGFQKGLEVLKGLLERYWDTLYPRLDPDDHFDPIERINILRSLSLEATLVQSPLDFTRTVIETPFCKSPQLGIYTYRDYLIANGEIQLPEGNTEPVPTLSQIKAAIKDTPQEEIAAVLSALDASAKHLSEINTIFSRSANGQSPNFENLESTLGKLSRVIKGNLDDQPQDQPQAAGDQATPAAAVAAVPAGGIRSKGDVIRVLDMICQYFESNEPSSPVPLLLRRAQKLTSKNFMELIEDLCPDAMNQVRAISGNTEQK